MRETIIVNNRVEYKLHSIYVLKYSHQINGVRGGAVGWGNAFSTPGSVFGILHWPKIWGHTLDLDQLNVLTEMSTRDIAWG